MKILLLAYLTTILVYSSFHFSLLKKEKMQRVAIIIPGLITFAFFRFSLRQNNETLDWLMKQENLISGIAILLIFEAIIIIFLTVIQIKSFYNLRYPSLWRWISIAPPLQLVVALIFMQTYFFLEVSGHSFVLLALAFFLGGGVVIRILTFGAETLVKKWESRAEFKALIALFQLLLSMFLPLIARGQKVAFTQIALDYFAIGFLVLLVLTISGVGYILFKKTDGNDLK